METEKSPPKKRIANTLSMKTNRQRKMSEDIV